MKEIIQKTKKIGGSLMIRIPSEIAELEHIKAGEIVSVKIQKIRTDWFGTVPELKPFNKEKDRARSKYE